MKKNFGAYDSILGTIYIVWNEKGIIKLELFKENWDKYLSKHNELIRDEISSTYLETIQQLQEYFNGKREKFNLPICIEGTEFQKQVWEAVLEIPYGETRCYSKIANRIGRPKATRAIGQANKVNPLPILIPCHRVIGKNGGMVGYAGSNINIKVKLLEFES